jgi:hypothetical protein
LVQGKLAAWRAHLNRWLVHANHEASRQVTAATQESTLGVHASLHRVRLACNNSEQEALPAQLQEAVAQGVTRTDEATVQATQSHRTVRAILNAALTGVAALEVENAINRNVVFQQLCLVFMDGMSLPHVWHIALSSILRTLETELWADPETTATGRLLQWFAAQIMEHVVLAEGACLSLAARRPINEALAPISQSEIITVHLSLEDVGYIRHRHCHYHPHPDECTMRRSNGSHFRN